MSSNTKALIYRTGTRTLIPAAVYLVSISRVVDNSGLGLLRWRCREEDERSVQSRGVLGGLFSNKRGIKQGIKVREEEGKCTTRLFKGFGLLYSSMTNRWTRHKTKGHPDVHSKNITNDGRCEKRDIKLGANKGGQLRPAGWNVPKSP